MYWKHFKILLTLLLVVLLMAPIAQAKRDEPGGGPPDDPADPGMPDELFSITGVVTSVVAYEQKEIIYIQTQSNFAEICRIPVDEPSVLNILTTSTGEKYILDWGPEWYVAASCLDADSWVCDPEFVEVVGDPVYQGPFLVGEFDCLTPMTVISAETFEPILLMTATERQNMLDGNHYVLGRSGGSEIFWLSGPNAGPGSGQGNDHEQICWNALNEAGSSIVWETAPVADGTIDEDNRRWWRNEAPPFAQVDELSCSISGE